MTEMAPDTARLETWLAREIPEFCGPVSISKFQGGQSNPTYRLDTPQRAYVLRRKPPGKLLPSAHQVDREFQVMSALYAVRYPVPRPFILCTDDNVIGTMFYVMEHVEGRIFWDGRLPELDPPRRAHLYDCMNANLAALHMLDHRALGLTDYGKEGAYVARQIARWSKQYRLSETQAIAAMERLIDWLPQNIPAGDTTCIVHGDYRLDNMIVAPDREEILAVIDWELSTLGDPLADFAYHLMQWRMPQSHRGGLLGADFSALGIPSEADYIGLYCERTKRNSLPNIDYYVAYNMFRLAAILQGIAGRVRDGTATAENAKQQAEMVVPLADAAWECARRAGAGGA